MDDELYVVAPDRFVARRKELVSELRAAGEKAAAAELATFRRPPRSAWALNVVARERPEVVERVLDAARAAARSLTEGSDDVRDDLAAYRAATDAVLDVAEELTDTRGSDWRDRMRSTIQAAGDDEDLAATLRAGRLVADHAASGFGGGAAATISVRRPRPPSSRPTRSGRDAARRAEAAAAEAARAAERARVEAERARVAKQRARLIRELDRARTKAERLERAADDAREAADSARRAADDVERDLQALAD